MRARNLKPGFFKNEDLAECSPLARILYQGLWCMADREGRMEYRPKRIKAEALPYDDVSIDDLLGQLLRYGFIIVYEVNDNKYLAIPKFKEHQNCHVREVDSSIPEPVEHCAEHNLGDAEHGSRPAESPLPLTESPLLKSTSKHPVSTCPHQEIVEIYHKTIPELPRVVKWTPKRAKHLQTCWADKNRQSLEWWRKYFTKIRDSDFLMGKSNGFKADLEWLTIEGNLVKVVEGRYDNKSDQESSIDAWARKKQEEERGAIRIHQNN